MQGPTGWPIDATRAVSAAFTATKLAVDLLSVTVDRQNLWRGGQLLERVLLDQVHITRGNRTTGIGIVAEGCSGYRLKRLRFAQVHITGSDDSTGVDIADEHAHLRADYIR